MERSLILLLKLRFFALMRRTKKGLSRPKGIVMAVVMALVFAPWMFTIIASSRVELKPPLEPIRRFAPLAVFVFTIASLLFSAGEQALYYSPAEVTFLFTGPYRKRQLLAFKLFTTILLCLVSALFFSMMSMIISPRWISSFVGMFLLILFLQSLQMVVGLASSTLGALAWNRGRLLLLVGLVAVVGLAFASVARDFGGAGPLEALQRVERSPVAWFVLSPFRWFVLTFTAERVWPDLIYWSTPAILMDLGLLGLIFALDASYLEAASASSARRFAQLQKLGAGGGSIRSVSGRKMGRFRFRPPSVPWWGGVGPNFWRQMTGALGDPSRLLGVLTMISIAPVILIAIKPSDPQKAESIPYVCLGMIGWMSVILSILIPYDFRGDVDLMEGLKSLPIAPNRIALGQLLTPTLIASTSQALAILIVIVGFGGLGLTPWAVLAFLLPINLLFYSIENLLFLWYPSRVVAGNFDVMAMGRQMLFMMAKFLGLGLGTGIAALAGVAAYFATGRAIVPALIVAWLAISAAAVALVPLVGQAFRKFDVAGDVPA